MKEPKILVSNFDFSVHGFVVVEGGELEQVRDFVRKKVSEKFGIVTPSIDVYADGTGFWRVHFRAATVGAQGKGIL